MSGTGDPQRRPVLYDLVNQRFFADPVGAGRYYPIPVAPILNGDQTIALINTATAATIAAARVVAASTSAAGVVRLNDTVASTSTAEAATANAVRTAHELANTANTAAGAAQTTANAALARSGGTMTGPITFAAGQTIAGYGLLDGTQSWTKAQRGSVVALTSTAGVVTPDFAAGNNFSLTLTEATTLDNPTNLTAGQSGFITVTQDATARTLSYGSSWKWEGGTPQISTTPSSVNTITYVVNSATHITAKLVNSPSGV